MRRRSYLPLPLELLIGSIGRILYRVRSRGTENVPAAGGAIIIANHLSYADVVVLQLACPRPLRYIGYVGPEMSPVLVRFFRLAGVIPITARHPAAGMRRAVDALKAGDLVCILPEGQISRTGQLMKIKGGFELLARRAAVPVIPVAVDGLWGSLLSFSGNKYIWKSPRIMRTSVFAAFGRPIPPGAADTAAARRALLDLGAEAFEERPVLRRHVGREAVRELAKAPWRLVMVDCTAERREISAARLLAVAAVLARRIRVTIPDRRIGILLPPGAGAFIANLAVVCTGRVPVNLNFTAGRAAAEASMRAAGILSVISAEAMRERLPDFPWPERTLDLRKEIVAAMAGSAIIPWVLAAWLLPNQWFADLLRLPRVGDRTEAALLFTSGSAGEPKGVILTHRNLLANCAQISSLSILPRNCTMLGCLPLFHSFGFAVTLWYPLLRGCRLVSVPGPLDTRRIAAVIEREKVTVLVGAPTFLRPLLKKARPAELRSLELVVAGAEKLSDDLYRRFLDAFQLEILEGYGLTETSPVVSVNQPDPQVTTATAGPQAGKKLGTVGRLMPGMTARIIDPVTRAELPLSSTGIVCLSGANVFSGYLDDDSATDAAFSGDWFVTGDMGRFDEDGFLTIEGRLSRFSKIGGEMVPHVAVEQKIADLLFPDQAEGPLVAVLGVPDPVKGEALVLLAAMAVDPAGLREGLVAAGLPNLWIPRSVVRVDKIPVLASGKLDLRACRDIALKSL